MQRTLQPELLDSLPSDHPAALHSRRDLRITNRVLGTHGWFAHTLPPLLHAGERALELGAGTGELLATLGAHGLWADGLDVCPRPAALPAPQAWHCADLREFGRCADYAIVFGNLIFHQFTADELAALGARLRQHARVIVASEPMRRRFSQTLFAAAGRLLGAHDITLHDARVSIAAGFRDDELPRALGLDPAEWTWRCTTSWLGSYRLVAIRRA
jgi:SAM-dependent methyltransferase